ncbi:serine hydrolase domain-containing protein [Bowdeniella nasicola]|nr:serine hydrolase domain-containing protein [Bowdeniella nasicola]
MNAVTAVDSLIERLTKQATRTVPTPPLVHVAGPQLSLSVGDPTQPFWIASIDKVFIATLTAQLFGRGDVSPATPIGQVLPSDVVEYLPVARGVVAGRDITIEHLLTHTAGLPDVFFPPRGLDTACSLANIRSNHERQWTTRELLEEVAALPPLARPGERFRYTDTAYLLLIRIAEDSAGDAYSNLLATRIFEPASMADTASWVGATGAVRENLATSLAPIYLDRSSGDVSKMLLPNLTWTSGIGGVSNAADLVRFQRALHTGALCDTVWLDYLGEPRHRFYPGIHYGAGMVRLKFSGLAPWMRGYPSPAGGLGFTATHMFYYGEYDTHVIVSFHSPMRMRASFAAHARLVKAIKSRT